MKIDQAALDALFLTARSHYAWLDKPVEPQLLQELYDLCKWPPTSANGNPMRVLFITSPSAKETLKPCLDKMNVEKSMTAPVVAVIAHDMEFYEKLPQLMPHNPASRNWFAGNDALIATTAFRNGTLQGAYLMLAARALGLDCGPISGFDNAKIDAAFFAGTTWKSNFLCNLGYGDVAKLFPRNPRLSFDDACKIL